MESKEAFICSVEYGKTFGVGGGGIIAFDCVNLKELVRTAGRCGFTVCLFFFFTTDCNPAP